MNKPDLKQLFINKEMINMIKYILKQKIDKEQNNNQ